MRILILLFLVSIGTYSFDIKVTDIEERKSLVYIAVFDSEDGFPFEGEEKSIFLWRGEPVEAESGVATNLPRGKYAVVIFQDTDGNENLTKKFYGAPKEPYGVSNATKKPKRKPKFDRRAVEVEEDEILKIRLWNP